MDLVANGKDFSFSFEVEVKPEFELSSYEPVEIELPAEGATDEEVETQIDQLREHYFELVDATAATKVKPENWVEIAIKATDDAGEDIPSITTESRLWGMDSTLLPQAFNDELMGMKKGQTKEFDIDVPAEAAGALLVEYQRTARTLSSDTPSITMLTNISAKSTEIERLALQLELEQIQASYEDGTISRGFARRMRENVNLMQLDLGDSI